MKPFQRIALAGNPNTGKTTIFNALTGLRQRVGNYPGITVERKSGFLKVNGTTHEIIDLPGLYSLNPVSADETIAWQTLIGTYPFEPEPDAVVVVADATNLTRNLYLVTQIMDTGLPMMLVLTMMDEAEAQLLRIDTPRLSNLLGIPVISVNARTPAGANTLKSAIATGQFVAPESLRWNPSLPLASAISRIRKEWIEPEGSIQPRSANLESLRLLSLPQNVSTPDSLSPKAQDIIKEACTTLITSGKTPEAIEILDRYRFIDEVMDQCVTTKSGRGITISDQIDRLVTHKIAGPVAFLMLLLVIFQAIFSWAEPFMELIDLGFITTGSWLRDTLPNGHLNSLIVDGILAGLGGVMIFLPQIMILFFFIALLEGTGYMARAAFVMDGFMMRIGMHGKSVLPLMSGFACAVPGIMATRSIENPRERLITMLVLPLMACSARLPVYALMISAFVPGDRVFGPFTWQGITFFGLYLLGMMLAGLAALVFKKTLKGTGHAPFMLELPSYKIPPITNILQLMLERGWVFIREAGRIIIAVSIVLWVLASFPAGDETMTQAEQLENSYAGKIGHLIEPAIAPLGFDWKIGIGLITSFAAREVMVATLSTIYSVQSEDDDTQSLRERMLADVNPETGEPVFSLLTALSLLVFFAVAMQCMSTLAIVKRETNSWKWPAFMLTYMTVLAWVLSFVVYQGGKLLFGL
jgi:ferrous iron transport protein B